MNLLSAHNVDHLVNELQDHIKAPYVRVHMSTLGGADRPSVLVTIGFDDPSGWTNGIFENSRYVKLHVLHTGEVSLVSDSGVKGAGANGFRRHALSKRFRKFHAKSLDEIVTKIQKYVKEVE